MIYDTIKNFNEQFEWQPRVENGELAKGYRNFVVAGMGGSNLAAGLIKIIKPELQIFEHRDYGLPALPKSVLQDTLLIADSYSGNTEETIDAFEEAGKLGLARLAVATGGKLLELAKKEGAPYIQMPAINIQPRMAVGYSFLATLKAIGAKDALKEAGKLTNILQPSDYEDEGKELAKRLKDHVPVIYASTSNAAIAYNWKIKFNETGKIPAFWNVLPELNHNEMTGFDVKEPTRGLSKNFYFIFLKDGADHPRVQKRLAILGKLYEDRKLPVEIIEIEGKNALHKIFSSLVLADWTAYYTAKEYGVEPEQVPMVEEFKKLIQ